MRRPPYTLFQSKLRATPAFQPHRLGFEGAIRHMFRDVAEYFIGCKSVITCRINELDEQYDLGHKVSAGATSPSPSPPLGTRRRFSGRLGCSIRRMQEAPAGPLSRDLEPDKARIHWLIAGGSLAVSLAVYAVFGLACISLPGPQQDEVLFLNAALPESMGTQVWAYLPIPQWKIPSMLLPYVGAQKGWIWRGLFQIWPPSIYSVRIPAVILGGLALILFYLWARKFYSRPTAVLALALAATDPAYIYTARLDWGPVVLGHVWKLGGLLLGALWLEAASPESRVTTGPRLLRLWAAAFCFGLGLWDKATFVWFLTALALSLLLLFPRQVMRNVRPVPVIVLVTGLLAGALPLLAYNYEAWGQGTNTMLRLEGLDRELLTHKISNLRMTLNADAVYGLIGGGEGISDAGSSGFGSLLVASLSLYSEFLGTPFPWLLLLAVAAAPFAAGHRRSIVFPFLVCGLMWAQMLMAKDGGSSPHHYVLAYPFPHLGLAAAASWAWEKGGRRRQPGAKAPGHRPRRALAALLAVLFIAQLSSGIRHLRLFYETGGRLFWSDAVYELAAFVDQRRPSQLIMMDWGFRGPFLLLNLGRIPIVEYELVGPDAWADPGRLAHVQGMIRQPNTLFLIHASGMEASPETQKLLSEAAARMGAKTRNVWNFNQRDGRPLAILIQFETSLPTAARE